MDQIHDLDRLRLSLDPIERNGNSPFRICLYRSEFGFRDIRTVLSLIRGQQRVGLAPDPAEVYVPVRTVIDRKKVFRISQLLHAEEDAFLFDCILIGALIRARFLFACIGNDGNALAFRTVGLYSFVRADKGRNAGHQEGDQRQNQRRRAQPFLSPFQQQGTKRKDRSPPQTKNAAGIIIF